MSARAAKGVKWEISGIRAGAGIGCGKVRELERDEEAESMGDGGNKLVLGMEADGGESVEGRNDETHLAPDVLERVAREA